MSEKRLKTDQIMIRLEPGEKERFKKAAEAAGLNEVSTWIRVILRREAKKLLQDEVPANPKAR